MLPAGQYTFDQDGKLVKDKLGLTTLSVQAASSQNDNDLGKINWYSAGSTNYIFLPACADSENLVMNYGTVANEAKVTYDDKELNSGEETNIFSDGNLTLNCADNEYNVSVLQGSSPAVFINTQYGTIANIHGDKEYKEAGDILIVDENGNVQYDGELDYIKGRGNTTWSAAKKPYNIKLDKSAGLFGMDSSKKWCLLANAADNSFVRNSISYDLAQKLGLVSTPSTILVDLYIDGNYMGAYLLTEKVEIAKGRVDIYNLESATEKVNEKDLDEYPLAGDQDSKEPNSYQYVDIPNNPENITGGYLLELEKDMRYPREASGFISARKQSVVVKSPEYATKDEVEYIRNYWQNMEDALYSATGYNSLGKYYTEYLDIDSLARMYIVQEFAVNFDGCNTSFYLYKDIEGKICAGPLWDFDLSFGENPNINHQLNNTTNYGDPNGLYIQHCYIQDVQQSYFSFLAQLFSHNDFQEKVQEIWNSEFDGAYSAMQEKLNDVSQNAYGSVVINSYRWGTFGTNGSESIISSYESKVNYIRNFMNARYEFLSNAYSDDTFFVKYDVGDEGKSLIHDTNIYSTGDTATVKNGPNAKDDALTFAYWSTNPDGTGEHYVKGDTITVTDNTNLYANWKTK